MFRSVRKDAIRKRDITDAAAEARVSIVSRHKDVPPGTTRCLVRLRFSFARIRRARTTRVANPSAPASAGAFDRFVTHAVRRDGTVRVVVAPLFRFFVPPFSRRDRCNCSKPK